MLPWPLNFSISSEILRSRCSTDVVSSIFSEMSSVSAAELSSMSSVESFGVFDSMWLESSSLIFDVLSSVMLMLSSDVLGSSSSNWLNCCAGGACDGGCCNG